MEVISEIVRNVTLLVILTLFLELILPSGELNGFIRMIMGLLLLAAVLNPFLDYIGKEPLEPVYRDQDYSKETAKILAEGEELSLTLEDQAREDYQRGLKGQIGAIVTLIPAVEEAEVGVGCNRDTGAIESITLKIVKGEGEPSRNELEAKITSTVCEFYGLDPSVLHLEISEREGSL